MDARPKSKARKWILRCSIFFALLVAAIHYGIPKILYSISHISTDNAFVAGTIIPISAEVQGNVVNVFVEENQIVKPGDLLLEIDDETYAGVAERAEKTLLKLGAEEEQIRASLKEKAEELKEAEADLETAKINEALSLKEQKRYFELAKQKRVSESRFDHVKTTWLAARMKRRAAIACVSKAKATIESLEAQLKMQGLKIEEARVSLRLARINLKKTKIRALIGGRVAKTNVDPGKYVQPGQKVLAILDESDIWVVANFKETQIEKMRIGQPVEIKVDAYSGVTFKGHIDSFQPGTGAVFSLLPPENATGNFVKVVQRIPVKIIIDSPLDPAHPLWPGLSVVPYVEIGKQHIQRFRIPLWDSHSSARSTSKRVGQIGRIK